MRFLLRPGWIAFLVAVGAFVVACYTLLAPWQFSREAERDAQSRAIAEADATPAVPFADLVPGGRIDAADQWHRVTLTGRFDPSAEAVVRLRVIDGAPAFEVLTPMRLTDGRTVAVNRGSVPAPEGPAAEEDAAPVVPGPPGGTVTVQGRLRTNENDPSGRPPLLGNGIPQIYAADSRALAGATGVRPVEGVVSLEQGQPGVLRPIPVAPTGGGAPFSNLSYALQWITFGAVAVVAAGIFIRLELLQRRGRRQTRASLRDQLAGRDGHSPSPAATRSSTATSPTATSSTATSPTASSSTPDGPAGRDT